MAKSKKARRDIQQEVTDQVVAALEAGTTPWKKSWKALGGQGGIALRHDGTPYRGINQFILSMTAYQSPYWMTYKQAKTYGGQVRGGEKGTAVVFYKKLRVADKDDADKTKQIWMTKCYTVFNADQIDGLPDRFDIDVTPASDDDRDATVDQFVTSTGVKLGHGGDRAYYQPGADSVQMPVFEAFESGDAYYATLLHELTHWTGHKSRCDRNLQTGFGTKDYAFEELVAEMGAAFLCAELAVNDTPRPDHASYIKNWLGKLKDDKRFLFKAATLAQAAVDHLHGYQEQEEEMAA